MDFFGVIIGLKGDTPTENIPFATANIKTVSRLFPKIKGQET